MSTESRESEKQIRSLSELMARLGYKLQEEDKKHSPYKCYEKVVDVENLISGRINVTETRIGSKHVLLSVGFDGIYSLPIELDKTVEGLLLPERKSEGYTNANLEGGGYNMIFKAITELESSRFFVEKSQEIRAEIEFTKRKKEQLEKTITEEVLSSIKAVLPGFDGVENGFLKNGIIYLFPKTENAEKMVPVVKLHIDVRSMTLQLTRSSSRLIQTEKGPMVNKNVFEKTRLVKKGKYQFPYYVWEGNMAELDMGVKKLELFMSEMKN